MCSEGEPVRVDRPASSRGSVGGLVGGAVGAGPLQGVVLAGVEGPGAGSPRAIFGWGVRAACCWRNAFTSTCAGGQGRCVFIYKIKVTSLVFLRHCH